MRQMMSDSLITFGQPSPEETASLASSHKRPVTARSCSPAKKSDCKGRKRQKSGGSWGKPEKSGVSLACPFYKWNPAVYGGENGCSSWCNENIETVIRHHVLGKHRKANRVFMANNGAHFLDDERFKEVVKFKRQRSSDKSKEKHAEEMWKAVYRLLFAVDVEAKDEIPDPYFVPTTRPNDSGYNIDELEKIIQRLVSEQPSLGVEVEHYCQQNAKLKREREREKEKLRLAAESQKGLLKAQINQAKAQINQAKAQINQVEAQIREIEEGQARRAQEIDADFDKRVNNNRALVMAIVNRQADPQTDFFHNLSPPPATQLGTEVGFLSQTTRQASPSLLSGSALGYAEAQSDFIEQNPEDLHQMDDTTASPTGTSTQIWSSDPSFSINQCRICEATLSNGSILCEGCCSISSLGVMP
jgi:hypothetical protein